MKDEKFIKAQWRFIAFSAISYAFFYIARKNLSMAQPAMLEDGVISTYALGIIMTVHGVLYGLSRFINGFWADRLNGRIFMAVGLALSAATNFLFGCSSLTLLFALFWILNGWAQGMGFPPCAKMLAHWIHPKELATKMSVWNASHSVGAVLALGLCSALFALGFGWRWCFWVPAALAVAAAVFTFLYVKETPVEAGLPPLELEPAAKGASGTLSAAERRRLVFGNRVIWLVALANFFVYVVRFGFLDWGPTFLKQMKGIPVAKGGLMIIAFELAAVVGTICAGWATDKVFKGRGCRTGVFFMLFAALFAFGFWRLPGGAPVWQATLLLMGAGFYRDHRREPGDEGGRRACDRLRWNHGLPFHYGLRNRHRVYQGTLWMGRGALFHRGVRDSRHGAFPVRVVCQGRRLRGQRPLSVNGIK